MTLSERSCVSRSANATKMASPSRRPAMSYTRMKKPEPLAPLWIVAILILPWSCSKTATSSKQDAAIATDAPISAAGGSSGASAGGSIGSGGRTGSGGSAGSGGSTLADAAIRDSQADGGTDALAADGATASAHCTPGTTGIAPWTFYSWDSCAPPTYPEAEQRGFPNGHNLNLQSFAWPSAMIPGIRNAFSLAISGNGPIDIELWGNHSLCGNAEELLWWTPLASGTLCAEFTPSQAFTHATIVYRQIHNGNYAFGPSAVTMCPGGSCPGGTVGEGKQPGTKLVAPIGNYEQMSADWFAGGAWELVFGGQGRIISGWLGNYNQMDKPQALGPGVVRMPGSDRFGDAWYCIGDGSFVVPRIDGSGFHRAFEVSLRGLTRLGACAGASGTGSLSASIANNEAALTTSITAWQASKLQADLDSCTGQRCSFRLVGDPQLYAIITQNSGDTGSYYSPTHATVPVSEATCLFQPSRTAPFQLACATSGSLYYDPGTTGTSTFTLSNLGNPVSCPGAPVDDDQLDFTVEDF
jgi:hypothetical protein